MDRDRQFGILRRLVLAIEAVKACEYRAERLGRSDGDIPARVLSRLLMAESGAAYEAHQDACRLAAEYEREFGPVPDGLVPTVPEFSTRAEITSRSAWMVGRDESAPKGSFKSLRWALRQRGHLTRLGWRGDLFVHMEDRRLFLGSYLDRAVVVPLALNVQMPGDDWVVCNQAWLSPKTRARLERMRASK